MRASASLGTMTISTSIYRHLAYWAFLLPTTTNASDTSTCGLFDLLKSSPTRDNVLAVLDLQFLDVWPSMSGHSISSHLPLETTFWQSSTCLFARSSPWRSLDARPFDVRTFLESNFDAEFTFIPAFVDDRMSTRQDDTVVFIVVLNHSRRYSARHHGDLRLAT